MELGLLRIEDVPHWPAFDLQQEYVLVFMFDPPQVAKRLGFDVVADRRSDELLFPGRWVASNDRSEPAQAFGRSPSYVGRGLEGLGEFGFPFAALAAA